MFVKFGVVEATFYPRAECSTVLLEKHLLKKFPKFYGNRRLIFVFARARHLLYPYPSLMNSIHTLLSNFLKILHYNTFYAYASKAVCFLQISHANPCGHFSPMCATDSTPLTPFALIHVARYSLHE
jgi:hypothetical protein